MPGPEMMLQPLNAAAVSDFLSLPLLNGNMSHYLQHIGMEI